MDLKKWDLFRDIDSSLTSMCKTAKIIDFPKVGFLVLQNDDVYAVTETADNFKWLGNGINFAAGVVRQASKVESLCGKRIRDFYGNESSFAALTEDECVYSWTSDSEDPSADGMPRKVAFPNDSSRAHVNQVSYGPCHTLCLTSDGEVFGWGDDECGQLGSGLERGRGCQVTKISGFTDRIVQVAAGYYTSYALDSHGKVWSWGNWENSSLGYRAYENQLTPKEIKYLSKIKKIATGGLHVLALSETGELYYWGNFDSRNKDTIKPLPLLIKKSEQGVLEPVIDIASTVDANYAVCQSKNKVYVWGMWFKKDIPKPKATEFSSMEEVFTCAESPIMLHPIRVKERFQRVTDAWKRAFNDQSTADVIFSVENEKLYAHSAFLKFRSEYFQSMFANGWEESKRDSSAIKIDGFSFHTFKAFMYYLYCERFIEPDMSVDDLLELMQAADYYRDGDLHLACVVKLKTKLTPQNACLVYAYAVKSNAEGLQNYAVEFMVPVFKEVVNSAECAKMDSDLKTKLMIQIADLGVIQLPKRRRIL